MSNEFVANWIVLFIALQVIVIGVICYILYSNIGNDSAFYRGLFTAVFLAGFVFAITISPLAPRLLGSAKTILLLQNGDEKRVGLLLEYFYNNRAGKRLFNHYLSVGESGEVGALSFDNNNKSVKLTTYLGGHGLFTTGEMSVTVDLWTGRQALNFADIAAELGEHRMEKLSNGDIRITNVKGEEKIVSMFNKDEILPV